jgi:hypothetical protein
MRQIPRAELLDAMKEGLRDLENTQLLSPDDLDIINQKRTLRQQIAKLEKESGRENVYLWTFRRSGPFPISS